MERQENIERHSAEIRLSTYIRLKKYTSPALLFFSVLSIETILMTEKTLYFSYQ